MAETSAQRPPAQAMRAWSWFLVAFGIAWCWLSVLVLAPRRHFWLDAYILGGTIGTAFFPFVIAYFIRGREKNREWNSFARWFFWLALILPSLRYIDVANERRAMRELGQQAVQEVTAFQRKYDSDTRCRFDPPLYSAASFASRKLMEGTIRQLSGCVSKYDEVEAERDRMIQSLETRAQSSIPSGESRDAFLNGFRQGYQRSASQRQSAAELRKHWKEETEALYDFAIQSAAQIHVQGEEVLISNDTVLTKFNRLLDAAKAAHLALAQLEIQAQGAGEAKMQELKDMVK